MTVEWARHAIWWQVYPLGFLGAPIRQPQTQPPQRTLRDLIDWLGYLVELGANGLLLGPIFRSASHGYDTLDHFEIDPRLGDEADWDALVAACRERGVRLCLDGVFNHVSSDHAWSRTHPDRLSSGVFEGHGDLVELNHANPEVAGYVADVMNHWMDRGADAWRLDAAYATPREFWLKALPAVRAAHPGGWIFGEVIHGDYAAFVSETGADSVTEYELWKAIWSSLSDANLFELDWTLKRHNDLLARFIPQTFIGNHDVTRIATQVGPDKAVLALVVLCTVGGIPSIYYGDEQGFTATKYDQPGGDDDIRPTFPRKPDDLNPCGEWLYRIHQQLLGIRRQHPWLVSCRTEVTELANERICYRSYCDDQVLGVELDLAGTPDAQVSLGSETLFAFPG